MSKSLAIIFFAFVACAANASIIEIQTGLYSGSGSFATADQYKTAVDSVVSASGSTLKLVASYDNLPVSINSGALKATINFGVSTAGLWDFRTGVDFGMGGAVYLDGVALDHKSNNMWWGGSYSNSSQYFDVSSTLAAGNHTLIIYGLENCCSGNEQAQFKAAGSSKFVSFGNTDGLVAAVPEPETYAMLLAGLGLVGAAVQRRKAKQA